MAKIIKLDKKLANQIAAGEVVERPISVVKELVENSVDAGATFIKVEIKNGGIDEVIVSDNGEGIEKDDLSLTLEKYSTSKIKNLEDLYNVMTFGFRGEALSSISSVCDFEIISRYISSNVGYSYKLEDDKGLLTKAAIDSGTKIIVKNLFHNTPARLNYLKQARTEYSHILSFLNSVSLSYPDIGFEFLSDGKKVFKYQGGEELKTRIYSVYGEEFSSNLLEIKSGSIGSEITGYISDPKVSFKNRNKQILFVNNRLIKSPIIYKSISNAYNRFIPHSSFPAYVLNIKIDPTLVDVNVHPRKQEIRFADESRIFKDFYHTIEDKLTKVSLVSVETSSNDKNQEIDIGNSFSNNKIKDTSKYYSGSGTKFKSYSPYKNVSHNPEQGQIKDAMSFSKSFMGGINKSSIENNSFEESTDLHDTPLGKIIGQTFNSYIIVESEKSIKILDQHALAERVIYEKLISSSHKAKTQGLLIGESLQLTGKELNILQNNIEIFLEMGFEIEIMSNSIVMINAIPDFVKKENLKNIIEGILDDIGEHSFKKSRTLDEVRNKIFAYSACRSAIKFGNKLNLFEMNKLLCDSAIDYSATCPHGRPVIFEIGLDELKDKYER